jgi:pimeloyl-ACP methyl ester carboxylesterase
VIAELGPGADPIAPDRPGWDGRTPATDLAGNAAAAVAALDAAGVERAIVVGHSLGGGVAVTLALEHPERVVALVLLAPAANTAALDTLDRLLAAPLLGPITSAAVLAGPGLALATRSLRGRLARRLELDERYLRAATRPLLTPAGWRSFIAEQRAIVRDLPQLEGRLDAVTVPTTIATGSADRVVRPAAARRLAAQIAGAELVVMERAGHLLPHREPRRVADLVHRALERTARPSLE